MRSAFLTESFCLCPDGRCRIYPVFSARLPSDRRQKRRRLAGRTRVRPAFFASGVRSAFSFAIGVRSALSFASGGCPFIFFCPGHPAAGYSLKKAGLRGVNQILCKILSRNLKTGRQNEGKKTKGGFLLKKYIGNRHRGVL